MCHLEQLILKVAQARVRDESRSIHKLFSVGSVLFESFRVSQSARMKPRLSDQNVNHDQAIKRSSDQAIERSSDQAIERSSDQAIKRSSDQAIKPTGVPKYRCAQVPKCGTQKTYYCFSVDFLFFQILLQNQMHIPCLSSTTSYSETYVFKL